MRVEVGADGHLWYGELARHARTGNSLGWQEVSVDDQVALCRQQPIFERLQVEFVDGLEQSLA